MLRGDMSYVPPEARLSVVAESADQKEFITSRVTDTTSVDEMADLADEIAGGAQDAAKVAKFRELAAFLRELGGILARGEDVKILYPHIERKVTRDYSFRPHLMGLLDERENLGGDAETTRIGLAPSEGTVIRPALAATAELDAERTAIVKLVKNPGSRRSDDRASAA